MFETNFSHATATPIPPNVQVDNAIDILHNFEAVVLLSPDCRGCKPLEPSRVRNGDAKANGSAPDDGTGGVMYFEVEDDLPFMPKRLWSGGVKYQADFLATPDGCDITVHAPGGFTSVNHWRLLREAIPEHGEATLEEAQTKDLLHAGTGGGGWYIQIISDARCNMTFAGVVKGFLKNSHIQLQNAFIEKLKAAPQQPRSRRPTLGRRRSSQF